MNFMELSKTVTLISPLISKYQTFISSLGFGALPLFHVVPQRACLFFFPSKTHTWHSAFKENKGKECNIDAFNPIEYPSFEATKCKNTPYFLKERISGNGRNTTAEKAQINISIDFLAPSHTHMKTCIYIHFRELKYEQFRRLKKYKTEYTEKLLNLLGVWKWRRYC